jgi:hypothetical protein
MYVDLFANLGALFQLPEGVHYVLVSGPLLGRFSWLYIIAARCRQTSEAFIRQPELVAQGLFDASNIPHASCEAAVERAVLKLVRHVAVDTNQ